MFERSEGFSVNQYFNLEDFQRAVDRELDNIVDGLRKLEKKVEGISEEKEKAKIPQAPPPPTLEEGTNTTGGNWNHPQGGTGLLYGENYWLYLNYPFSKEGSNDSLAKIVIRLYLGGAGKLTYFLLEQELIALIALTVWKAKPDEPGTYEDPIGLTFTKQITQVEASQGYADFYVLDPRIDINDRVSIILVALASSGGTAETSYGIHDRDFTAGDGIPVPEALEVIKRKRKEHYIKIKLKFNNDYVANPPFINCCNHYDRIEVWTADMDKDDNNEEPWDGESSNPDEAGATGWELEKTIDLKRKVKKIKKLTEQNAPQSQIDKHKIIKVRIACEKGERHREAFRIVDDLGQKGPWDNKPIPIVDKQKIYIILEPNPSYPTEPAYILVFDWETKTWSKINIEEKISLHSSIPRVGHIFYNNGLYLLVKTASDKFSLYRSLDNGENWSLVADGFNWGYNPYLNPTSHNSEYFYAFKNITTNGAYPLIRFNFSNGIMDTINSGFASVFFGGVTLPLFHCNSGQGLLAISHPLYTRGIPSGNYRGEIMIVKDVNKYKEVVGTVTYDSGTGANYLNATGIETSDLGSPISIIYNNAPRNDWGVLDTIIDTNTTKLRSFNLTTSIQSTFRIFTGVKLYPITSSNVNAVMTNNYGYITLDEKLLTWITTTPYRLWIYDINTNTWSEAITIPKLFRWVRFSDLMNKYYAVYDMGSNETGVKYSENCIDWYECTEEDVALSNYMTNIVEDEEIGVIVATQKTSDYKVYLKIVKGGQVVAKYFCDLDINWSKYINCFSRSLRHYIAVKPKTFGPNPDVTQNKDPIYLLVRNLTEGASEKRRIYRTRDRCLSFDKVWGDGTDNEMVRADLEVEFLNNDYTRVYRLSGDGVGFEAKYSDNDWQWYTFFNKRETFKELELARDTFAYLCDNYNIWRTADRTANKIEWVKIWDYQGTGDTKIEHIALDFNTSELFAVSRTGKLYYCSNPYSYAEFSDGVDTGFGKDEIQKIVITTNYVFVFGNNSNFKIRRVDKEKVVNGTATSSDFVTINAPNCGDIEQNSVFCDYENENVAIIVSRNAPKGVWVCENFLSDTPTWSNELSNGKELRCITKINNLSNTYLVAGNNAIYILKSDKDGWKLETTNGIEELLDGKDFRIVALATPRIIKQTGGTT